MKIKGFDKDLKCRGFQFEIGKTYDTGAKANEIKLCSNTVFHYCDSLEKVNAHYSCLNESNRFCEIEVLGAEVTDGNKFGSNKIKIVREIDGNELAMLKGLTNGNTGIFNSGNWNSGDWNSGYANSCFGSNGVFCNKDDDNIRIFNKPSGMSLKEFYDSKYFNALCSVPFILTEWIPYEEKEMDTPEKKSRKGYLKTYAYKEAWKNWWSLLTDENKKIIQEIPNFDAKIFYDITGIEVTKNKALRPS